MQVASTPFELLTLSEALNYQKWIFRSIQPFLGSRILEVGAGIGNLSKWLPIRDKLILTEADSSLFVQLQNCFRNLANNPRLSIQKFDLLNDPIHPFLSEKLDTIVSFNVIEHLKDDRKVLSLLCQVLSTSPDTTRRRLITFVPAHSWAYGKLDEVLGHYRRYSKGLLQEIFSEIAPEASTQIFYFNLPGLLAWFIHGKILRKSKIDLQSVKTFEKLCPYFGPIDDFLHQALHLPLGQSVISVTTWERGA